MWCSVFIVNDIYINIYNIFIYIDNIFIDNRYICRETGIYICIYIYI